MVLSEFFFRTPGTFKKKNLVGKKNSEFFFFGGRFKTPGTFLSENKISVKYSKLIPFYNNILSVMIACKQI